MLWLCVPYFEPEVYDYFYDRSWEEINKPYQKALIKDRFDEFKKIKVKPHINYQLCAEIDKLFENLIDNKEININNRTRVMDICRDWSKLVESTGSLEHLFEVWTLQNRRSKESSWTKIVHSYLYKSLLFFCSQI